MCGKDADSAGFLIWVVTNIYCRENRDVLCEKRVSTAVTVKFIVVLNVIRLGR